MVLTSNHSSVKDQISNHLLDGSLHDYQFIRSIGKGSYGNVYLAKNIKTNENFAIKTVDLESLLKTRAGHDFFPLQEALICSRLNHPNIIKIHHYYESNGTAFIVQDYISGGDLFDAIQPNFGLPEHRARKYIHQIASSLHCMHTQGLVHRDIKPENVMIDENDNAILIDFGMAGYESDFIYSSAGTVPYMPPELYSAEQTQSRKHDAAADVWATGVLFYTMLAGNFPWRKACPYTDPSYQNFVQGKLSEPWTSFSVALQDLFSRMLAPEPAKRCSMEYVLQNLNMDFYTLAPIDYPLFPVPDCVPSLSAASSISESLFMCPPVTPVGSVPSILLNTVPEEKSTTSLNAINSNTNHNQKLYSNCPVSAKPSLEPHPKTKYRRNSALLSAASMILMGLLSKTKHSTQTTPTPLHETSATLPYAKKDPKSTPAPGNSSLSQPPQHHFDKVKPKFQKRAFSGIFREYVQI
eukprot:Sdes_comp19307_c0_seq1m10423